MATVDVGRQNWRPTMSDEDKIRRDWLKVKHKKKEGICMHCGKKTGDKSYICDSCYAKYSPGMLADLEG